MRIYPLTTSNSYHTPLPKLLCPLDTGNKPHLNALSPHVNQPPNPFSLTFWISFCSLPLGASLVCVLSLEESVHYPLYLYFLSLPFPHMGTWIVFQILAFLLLPAVKLTMETTPQLQTKARLQHPIALYQLHFLNLNFRMFFWTAPLRFHIGCSPWTPCPHLSCTNACHAIQSPLPDTLPRKASEIYCVLNKLPLLPRNHPERDRHMLLSASRQPQWQGFHLSH